MATAFRQEAEDDLQPLDEPSQQTTAHKKQYDQNDNANNRQYRHLSLFFFVESLKDSLAHPPDGVR